MNVTYFKERLSALTRLRLGFDGALVEQGSPEWQKMRLGVISASRASDLIAAGKPAPFPSELKIITEGRGNNSVTFLGQTFNGTKADCEKWVRDQLPPVPSSARSGYLLELVAEIATGQPKDFGEYKQTEWGKRHEAAAREIFAFHVGVEIDPIAFIYQDERMRAGCSPDGLARTGAGGCELKCPWTTTVYLDFLLNGAIKSEYIDQVQFSMFITGDDHWTFANYDPRMKVSSFHAITIERDEAKMKTFADAIGQMSYDLDLALDKIGLKFGDQWAHVPAELQAVDHALAEVA